jgi:hypothetical protein
MELWDGRCRRKYVRLKLPGTIGELSITAIGAYRITSNSRKVLVLDISPGGFRFASGLRFPARRKIRVSIRLPIAGAGFAAEGWIVWRKPNENVFEYGVEFDIGPERRALLVRLLNRLCADLMPYRHRILQQYASLSSRHAGRERRRVDCRV